MATDLEQAAVIATDGTTVSRTLTGRLRTLKLASWLGKEKRSPLYFTISSLAIAFVQMIGSVIVVRYVLPVELGLWQTANLALTYSFFLLAGVHNGLSRELPYFLGAEDSGAATRLAGAALAFTSAGCLLTLISGATTTAYLLFKHYDLKVILAAVAATLLIAIGFYSNYLVLTFRSKSSFLILARVQIWQALLLLATIPAIYFLRYEGMLLRLVFVGAVTLYLTHRARPMKIAAAWNAQSLQLLFMTGIPIFALDYLRSCASTVDRLALLRFGGVQEVGYYALAMSVYGAFEVIPVSIGHYIYPRMSYSYGRDKDPRVLWTLAWKIGLILIGIMLPLAVAGFVALPHIVRVLFPKYVAGTRAAQITIFAALCAGGSVGVNALWSLKAWKWMVTQQVSLAVFLSVGPFIGIKLCSSPLSGVAWGMLGGRFLGFLAGMVFTYIATHPRTSRRPFQSSVHSR